MNIQIRKMCAGDYDAAIVILEKWNMAPVAPSDDIEDPERGELDVEKSFVAVDDGPMLGELLIIS